MKILFVCEGNVNRSQMAATMLKQQMPTADISSAGTMVPHIREGQQVATVEDRGIAAMQEIGFDMRQSVMHQLTPQMIADADKVVLVGPTPGGPLPEYLSDSPKLEIWDVPDPGYGEIDHEGARDLIMEKVQALSQALESA